MASSLAGLLTGSSRNGFISHAKKLLSSSSWCPRKLRENIAVVYCTTPQATNEDIIDTAVSELIRQLLEHADEIAVLLRRLGRDVQTGDIAEEDVWQKVFEKGFSYLQSDLSSAARKVFPEKHLYKRLHECLSKSGKVAQSNNGKAYGPPDLPPESPVAPKDERSIAGLPEPEDVPLNKVISRKYLVPQALRFWNLYITERLGGIPHFVPFYMLQIWLCKKYLLLPLSQQEGLYAEGEDGPSEILSDPRLASTNTPDVCLVEKELQERAENFVLTLSDLQAALCFLYYTDEPARMEDVAHTLGFRSASGLDRHKKHFEARLRDFMAEYSDLLEQNPAGRQKAQDFLDAVYDACKNRYLASKSKTGGLHHE